MFLEGFFVKFKYWSFWSKLNFLAVSSSHLFQVQVGAGRRWTPGCGPICRGTMPIYRVNLYLVFDLSLPTVYQWSFIFQNLNEKHVQLQTSGDLCIFSFKPSAKDRVLRWRLKETQRQLSLTSEELQRTRHRRVIQWDHCSCGIWWLQKMPQNLVCRVWV